MSATGPSLDAETEKKIADITERALEYALIPFGVGVASVNPEVTITTDVVQRLKSRYRPGMRDWLLKNGIEFDNELRDYLVRRGRQLGSKAARMASEFKATSIDGNLFDDAAAGVEAEIQRLAKRYESLYTKKLDVICPPATL